MFIELHDNESSPSLDRTNVLHNRSLKSFATRAVLHSAIEYNETTQREQGNINGNIFYCCSFTASDKVNIDNDKPFNNNQEEM